MANQDPTSWSRNKIVRTVLIVLAVLAVIALVLFSEQIGQLLEFFGSRAAIELEYSPGDTTLITGNEVDGFTTSAHPFGTTGHQTFGDLVIDSNGNLILEPVE